MLAGVLTYPAKLLCHRGRRAPSISLPRALAAGALCVLALTGAPAQAGAVAPAKNRAVARQNAAATHAYLVANIAWIEAQLANLPQSTVAAEAAATQIAGECPGVLTNAPPREEKPGSIIGTQSEPEGGARATGERNRESKQRSVFQLELAVALKGSTTQADREASDTLTRAIAPLRWSNPVITGVVQLSMTVEQEELTIPPPAVCADMSSWVSSGYKTLSQGSQALAKSTLVKHAFEIFGLVLSGSVRPLPQLLMHYESASDRALARRYGALTAELGKASKGHSALLKRVESTVGLPIPRPKPPIKRPTSKAVAIYKGKTAAGESFLVSAQRTPAQISRRRCSVDVSITDPSQPASASLLGILNGKSPDRCLSRSRVNPEPKVSCNTGLLTIEASLLPAAREVRLLLSDGRTITSPAIRVPTRLGGPAGLYYQVIRGPSPIPVSLTELDVHGNVLGVLKLPAVVECTKHLVRFFPGGNVRLVHGSVPEGPTFTIRAERFRELGNIHFELKFEANNEEELFGGGGGGEFELRAEEDSFPARGRVFAPKTSSGCKPQPYAIIYGLLKAPHDSVLARVSGRLVPLSSVAIPARLHAGGVLAYGVFSPLPTELVTRDAHGRIVATDSNLRQAALNYTETCEGEAES